MGYFRTAERSLIFQELEKEDRKKYFDLKLKKFIHNIDSLYYVIKVKNDWNHDARCVVFRDYLQKQKEKAVVSFDPHILDYFGMDYVMNGIGSAPYQYDIEKKDQYMIFVMAHQLNKDTPELWVQIRSQFLWLYGEYYAVDNSIKEVTSILDKFGIEIQEIKENRIDFAYHTNYIQDHMRFFKEEDLNRMQESRFSRASKEYKFVGEFEIESDYITLGRKKSNNLFFRAYNKTKEVIEQGYKQFFIKLWLLEGMINYFDFYCLDMAFRENSYKYLDVARLEFYLEFGQDLKIKQKIKELINTKSKDYDVIMAFADKIVPKVTLITNIEIETKRKFYYSLDASVDTILQLKSDVPSYARKLYIKLDNKQVFHNYLTKNNPECEGIIRFLDYKAKNKLGKAWTRKSKFPTAKWWIMLQKVKVNRRFDHEDANLLREYQKNLDIEKIKKRTVNAILTHKVYLNHEDIETSFEDDILDFIANVNENDTQDAIKYKIKKFALLKNRLDDLEKTEAKRTFRLLNNETGEVID